MEEMLISRPSTGTLHDTMSKKGRERIQLDCLKKMKEELKEIWASTVLSDIHQIDLPSFKLRALRSLRSPFSHDCPLVEVLIHLVGKKLGILTPPLIPRYVCLPLFELCQIALLWSIAGFAKEASSLAHSIFPLIDFPTLWCKEEDYNEVESSLSLSFFRTGPTNIDRSSSPFFQAIDQLFSGFDVPCSIESFSFEPLFFHSIDIQGALTLLGKKTPLGTLHSKDVEIRAFGPQALPLSDLSRFGIERVLRGKDGWTNVSAWPEVWLHVKKFFEKGLDVRFLGLTQATPLHFSFYIKAPQAKIGNALFLPKNLNRYQGDSKQVVFGDKFFIESCLSTEMELIPLAGEGCFWGAEFLLSFQIHPSEARGLFKWDLIR